MATEKIYLHAMIPLIAKIGGSLAGSQSQKIHYIKPSGESGYWPASIDDPVLGTIIYDTAEADLDEEGIWHLQGWEKDNAGRENHGQTYDLEIFALGE